MGEEIGWRGSVQPRLDAAGVRSSIMIVWLFQLAYHAPLIAGADYGLVGEDYRTSLRALRHQRSSGLVHHGERVVSCAQPLAGGLLPQLSQHNLAVAVIPKFYTVSDDQPWLRGEMGLLPMIGYIVLGTSMYAWMRLRGQSWASLSREALAPRSL